MGEERRVGWSDIRHDMTSTVSDNTHALFGGRQHDHNSLAQSDQGRSRRLAEG